MTTMFDRPPASADAMTTPHVREWTVRLSIFETGDDTSAHAVLLAGDLGHLRAEGRSHRSEHDRPAREIGDEVAVARALRHLADALMATADSEILATMGEETHTRRD